MHTIRGKLSLAFLLIIAVCLIPTSAAAAYVIRYYQRQDAIERLSSFGQTVAGAASARQFSQFTPTDIVNLFNAQKSSNVLVVYTDAGGVVQADSENKYVGTIWPVSANQADTRAPPLRPVYQGRFTAPDAVSFAVATYRVERRRPFGMGNPLAGAPADQQAATAFIIVATPQSALTDAWSVIIGRLRWVMIAALLVSVFVAFVLSRSLTSRLQTLTQGANAMASGDYDRAMRLASVRSSNDEIGDLANAFQTMATNVARAQQAQRELVANVSHELKTPLTSIQGFSQAMIDGTVTNDSENEYQDLAQIIQQESQRMRRLVEQMLELSRLESGTVRLDVAPLRVDELVENVGRRYARLGEVKGITVRWVSPHDLVINADAGRLEQVLVNLLDNALQYTDTGGQVTVSARTARPNRVEFVIEDTGRGIPPDDVPRLFERFYQVERSRTGQGKHVGLGLAIVREIVDGHQGEIAVRSSLGAGTTIVVTIPHTVGTAARADVFRPLEKYAADARATVAS